MWFVYILECGDKTLYTGITEDVSRRLKAHQEGRGGRYTRSHGARRMVYIEKCRTRNKALRREAEIKSLRREKKFVLAQARRRSPFYGQ